MSIVSIVSDIAKPRETGKEDFESEVAARFGLVFFALRRTLPWSFANYGGSRSQPI